MESNKVYLRHCFPILIKNITATINKLVCEI